jgi:hypothetical protein
MNQIVDSDIDIAAFNSSGNVAIADACSGDQVTVTLTYWHRFIMPLTTGITGSQPLPISASITNTILQPLCP